MEIHYRLSWTCSWIFINLERKHYIKSFSGRPQECSKMRIKEKKKEKGACFEVAMNVPEETKQNYKTRHKTPKTQTMDPEKNVAEEGLPLLPIVPS